jgi:hypothetical protein
MLDRSVSKVKGWTAGVQVPGRDGIIVCHEVQNVVVTQNASQSTGANYICAYNFSYFIFYENKGFYFILH